MTVAVEHSPTNELRGFYDFMWGSEVGFVYVPYKIQSTGQWKKVMYEWPKNKSEIIKHTLAQSAEGNDIYFAPVVFSEARPLKENVKGSHVLWADFDGTIPNSFKAAGARLTAQDGSEAPGGQSADEAATDPSRPLQDGLWGLPAPTMRVRSSTEDHQHVYWRLNEFTTDVDFIENTNRGLAYTLKADTSGWDVNQVLRPPLTTNYKHNLPVEVIIQTGVVVSPDSFLNSDLLNSWFRNRWTLPRSLKSLT